VVLLLVLPFAIGNMNNGQANPLVLALVLACVAAAAGQRWYWAAACTALASLLKIYPVAVGLLLSALYPRRFAGRFALMLAGGLLLPFLFQGPDYVAAQYDGWARSVLGDDRSILAAEFAYRDLALLCRAWLIPLSPAGYRAAQLLAGAGMAFLCLACRRGGWPEHRTLALLFTLGSCWMTLFGPATESCTYLLLAPALAFAVREAWLPGGSVAARVTVLVCYGLMAVAAAACWFPAGRSFQALGPQPAAALLFLVHVLTRWNGAVAWPRISPC
jgi:hypothetical protein